jgi:hypothetical protein
MYCTAHRCCLAGRAQISDNVVLLLARGVGVDHRPRRPCTVAPPSCAPRLPMMYQCSLWWNGGRAQMSDNVDSSRRAVRCRPSMSPPVHGGAAVVCAKVAYDVPVLAVVIRRDERRCRTMSTRRGARCSVDHRPRCPCTVAPPSCAPRLPMMYQCSLWWNGGPRADVGQCRLVEARGAVSTIDLAACARWRRRRVRQGCLRCTSTRCRHSAGRAQISDNVDSLRRATQCRPSVSPPVRAGAVERLKCMIAHMVALNETI